VFCISAPDTQTRADRLAVTLGEHMATEDEIHLTNNAVQSGWEHDPGRAGWLGRQPHTHPRCDSAATAPCWWADRRRARCPPTARVHAGFVGEAARAASRRDPEAIAGPLSRPADGSHDLLQPRGFAPRIKLQPSRVRDWRGFGGHRPLPRGRERADRARGSASRTSRGAERCAGGKSLRADHREQLEPVGVL
jgi:hypothetical protein